MKFKFTIKKSLKIAMIVFFIIIAVGAGLIISRLAIYGADAFSIVSLIFALIVLVALLLMLFNTSYTFQPENLKISLGLMAQKIKYTDIVAIKNYVKFNEMFIIFRPNNPKEEGDLTQIMINIKPELYTDFVECLKAKNSQIVYDEIDANIEEE